MKLICYIALFLAAATDGCPLPWRQLANRRWYLMAEDNFGTFAEVSKYCKNNGGYVVDISSDAEYFTLAIKLGNFRQN